MFKQRLRTKAQSLRSRQTDAEARLWYRLRDRRLEGWKFRRQHPIGRYVADFDCLDARLVIEVDGATHSTGREQDRDRERSATLAAAGFLVLRVSNMDVYENIDGVLQEILDTIRSSGLASPLPEGEVDGEAGG